MLELSGGFVPENGTNPPETQVRQDGLTRLVHAPGWATGAGLIAAGVFGAAYLAWSAFEVFPGRHRRAVPASDR